MGTFTNWEKLQSASPLRKMGYKYRLTEEATYESDLFFRWGNRLVTSTGGYVTLDPVNRRLTFKAGYCWDGASGPTFDTGSSMFGSLVHDGLYQLFREGLIEQAGYRDIADMLLRRICIEQGMSTWRANLWTWAVLTFGGRHARRTR